MDAETVKLGMAILAPLAPVVIWLIRLEGQVKTNKALQDELRNDVRYIRDRIDRALNGHGE